MNGSLFTNDIHMHENTLTSNDSCTHSNPNASEDKQLAEQPTYYNKRGGQQALKKRTDRYLPMIVIRTKTCRHSMTASSMKIPKDQKTSSLLNRPHTTINERGQQASQKRMDHYLPMVAICTKTCRHSMTASSTKIPKNQKTSSLLNNPHTTVKEKVGKRGKDERITIYQ